VFAVVGRGLVTVQLDGTGMIAGPPARGRTFDVGSAEASEQSATARRELEVRIVVCWLSRDCDRGKEDVDCGST
jgi:hypothetical protein